MFDEVAENEKNYIVGQVVTTFYENATNFYKVLLVNVKDTNTPYMAQEIVVTGTFGQIQEDEIYRFFGDIVNHPRYGEQLKVDSYQQDKPTSQTGMIQYLSSDKLYVINLKDISSPITLNSLCPNQIKSFTPVFNSE